MKSNLREFLEGYLDCALWSSSALGAEEDKDHEFADAFKLGRGETVRMAMPAARWYLKHREALERAADLLERGEWSGPEHVGHNAWLSAAGHGTGFWDRSALDVCAYGCGPMTPYDLDKSKRPCAQCGAEHPFGALLHELTKEGLGSVEFGGFGVYVEDGAEVLEWLGS